MQNVRPKTSSPIATLAPKLLALGADARVGHSKMAQALSFTAREVDRVIPKLGLVVTGDALIFIVLVTGPVGSRDAVFTSAGVDGTRYGSVKGLLWVVAGIAGAAGSDAVDRALARRQGRAVVAMADIGVAPELVEMVVRVAVAALVLAVFLALLVGGGTTVVASTGVGYASVVLEVVKSSASMALDFVVFIAGSVRHRFPIVTDATVFLAKSTFRGRVERQMPTLVARHASRIAVFFTATADSSLPMATLALIGDAVQIFCLQSIAFMAPIALVALVRIVSKTDRYSVLAGESPFLAKGGDVSFMEVVA